MGNLLATRTRRLSLFQTNPFGRHSASRNLWILPAMVMSLAFLFFFSYVPFFQKTFLTRVSDSLIPYHRLVCILIHGRLGSSCRTHLHPLHIRHCYSLLGRGEKVLCQEVPQGSVGEDSLVIHRYRQVDRWYHTPIVTFWP